MRDTKSGTRSEIEKERETGIESERPGAGG